MAASEKALAPCSGQMAPGMKANGKKASLMAKESSITLMETFMMDSGKTISVMAMVSTPIRKGPSIRETGKMTHNRVKAQRRGQRAPNMSALI